MGQIFAPAAGLNRDKDGKIEVVAEQAQKPVSRFVPGRAAAMAKEETKSYEQPEQEISEPVKPT
jgi:hypothetical protein